MVLADRTRLRRIESLWLGANRRPRRVSEFPRRVCSLELARVDAACDQCLRKGARKRRPTKGHLMEATVIDSDPH